jgi:hypothetical protein
MPSATFAPRIEIIADLPIQQGDTSIIIVLKGETFEIPDDKAQGYIALRLAEEA